MPRLVDLRADPVGARLALEPSDIVLLTGDAFHNTPHTLSVTRGARLTSGLAVAVAVMQVDPDSCPGQYGGWATHGWWNLNPGESKTAIWTKYDAAYYYARAGNGAWWGDGNGPRVYVNPFDRFDSCLLIGTSTWDIVNMKRVFVGSNLHNTHTVNLNP